MFKVYWDNGHACGTFADEFFEHRDAEHFGREWKREMVALDDNWKAAREAYSWEVIEVPDKDSEDKDIPTHECPSCFAKEWSKVKNADDEMVYVCEACGQSVEVD